jgi:NAD(P)-dependent dehydrogenase (short-subunit alcohol dehydrogenase family)
LKAAYLTFNNLAVRIQMIKTVLISGAGSGIGRETAIVLSRENYKIILLGRNKNKLEESRKQLNRPEFHDIIAVDTTDLPSVRKALKSLNPSIYGIIANAGISGENQYDDGDRWNEIINTNLTGTYQLIKESLFYMNSSETEYKHITIISSVLARIGVPNYTAYCTSKAGLNGLMRSLAAELASKKILVNSICPGWVNTQMARDGIKTFSETMNMQYEEMYKEQMSYVPLNKMSEPEEIGQFIKYLLSEYNVSITGQTLDINNGAYMAP